MKDRDNLEKILAEAGKAEREADMSAEAIASTRKRVAEIIAEQAAAERSPAAPWGRAHIAAAAAAVIVSLLAGSYVRYMGGPDSTGSLTEKGHIDAERIIAGLQRELDDDLQGFRDRWFKSEGESLADLDRTELSGRIALYSREIEKELRIGEPQNSRIHEL